MVKYLVAPTQMPGKRDVVQMGSLRHVAAGMVLLTIVYYCGADLYLIDPGRRSRSARRPCSALPGRAGGWPMTGCASRGRRKRPQVFAVAGSCSWSPSATPITSSSAAVAPSCRWGPSSTPSRSPSRHRHHPEPEGASWPICSPAASLIQLGAAGKQRSLHNNYLTLPVIFVMIGNHYPLAFATRFNWGSSALVMVMGVLIRHFYNTRHKGLPSPWWTWAVAAAGMVLVMLLSAAGPSTSEEAAAPPAAPVTFAQAAGGGARPVQHV